MFFFVVKFTYIKQHAVVMFLKQLQYEEVKGSMSQATFLDMVSQIVLFILPRGSIFQFCRETFFFLYVPEQA